MRIVGSLAAVALMTAVSLQPVLVRADATSDARAAIQSAYKKVNEAAARKDANAILAVYAPDYVSVGRKGEVHKLAEVKQNFQRIISAAQSIKGTTTIQKFSLKGKQAVATIKDHTEIVVVNPQNAQQTAKLVADTTSEDTWVKAGKGWLQKKSKEISSRQTLNGKEMKSP
jgi:ketosteroid isomerase-like protein